MVVTGARNEDDARLAARKTVKVLQRIGYPEARFETFRVQNLVGSADVGFPVRLEGIAAEHAAFAVYEPELFPGLIYRMEVPRSVVLVFVSGRVIVTGTKSRRDILDTFNRIYPLLSNFRKRTTAADAGSAQTAAVGGGAAGRAPLALPPAPAPEPADDVSDEASEAEDDDEEY